MGGVGATIQTQVDIVMGPVCAVTNLKTFGERSFGYIAPTVWNSLPANLRASPSQLSKLT